VRVVDSSFNHKFLKIVGKLVEIKLSGLLYTFIECFPILLIEVGEFFHLV